MIRKPVQHSLAGIANGVSLKLGGLGTLVFVSPMPQSLRINGDKLSHFFRLVIFRGFNTEIVRRICGLRLRNWRKGSRNRGARDGVHDHLLLAGPSAFSSVFLPLLPSRHLACCTAPLPALAVGTYQCLTTHAATGRGSNSRRIDSNRRAMSLTSSNCFFVGTADRRLMSAKDISLFRAIGADSLLLQPTSALSSLNRAIRAALPDLGPFVRVELRHHGQIVAERGGHVPKRTMANQLNGSSVAESVIVFWQSSDFITSKCPSQGCQTGPAALSPYGLSR